MNSRSCTALVMSSLAVMALLLSGCSNTGESPTAGGAKPEVVVRDLVVSPESSEPLVETSQTLTVDVPDVIRTQLENGVPGERFAFYALASTRSITWGQLDSQGLLVVCDNYPPLVSGEIQSALGSFSPGTVVTFEKGTNAVDLDIRIPVGSSLSGRLDWAVQDEMPKFPGLVLLTERAAASALDSELVEVSFK